MNLIIQSTQDISDAHIKNLLVFSASIRYAKIADHAYRLEEAQQTDEVAAYCYENRFDYAYVRESLQLSNFGLLVMDMDSTLINIECIDEIADMHGLKTQVAAITAAAMRGELDFAQSLRRRVALLKGLPESALQRVYDQRLQLNPGAETMLNKIKELGIKTLLVSGGFTFFTERLKTRLSLDYAQANTLEIIDGHLTGKLIGDIVDAQAKADWLNHMRLALNLEPQQVIAIGDGANDLKMLAQASVSIAYHAKPIVRSQADFALNFVGLDGLLALLD